MKIRLHPHQGKEGLLVRALVDKGVKFVSGPAGIYLTDCDVGKEQQAITKAHNRGERVVLFSHAAPVTLVWDGIRKVHPDIDLFLAQTPGQKNVMESYGYPHPISVIGWHYCTIKPFKPTENVKSVLFAASHPDSNGIMPQSVEANQRTFAKLRALGLSLTVRYARSLGRSGLTRESGVNYQQSDYTIASSVKAIDQADVIVADNCTFASLAVARGKPVVMHAQNIGGHRLDANTIGDYKHWDDYKDYLRYGYDLDDYDNAGDVIAKALQKQDDEWYNKFISSPLNADKLHRMMR